MEDIHRICEATCHDLTPYISRHLVENWQEKVIHKEENPRFWYQPNNAYEIYTVFYAYLDKFIINPECCKENRSTFSFKLAENSTQREVERLKHGYEMLEKLLELDENNFPEDDDPSIYSKIEHFYNQHYNRCFSCTYTYNGVGKHYVCATCMKDEIIKEELMHKKEMWFNTGFKNVYMMHKSLFIRYEHMFFEISVVTKPLGEITSVADLFFNRAATVRFTHCKSRTPPCLTRSCATTIGEILEWDGKKKEQLGLPITLQEYLLEIWDETKMLREIYGKENYEVDNVGIISNGTHSGTYILYR